MAKIDFNGEVSFIATSCNAFNEPFGKTAVKKSNAKLFIAGISELNGRTAAFLISQVFINYVLDDMSIKTSFLEAKKSTEYQNYLKGTPSGTPGIIGIAGVKNTIPNLFPTVKSVKIFNQNIETVAAGPFSAYKVTFNIFNENSKKTTDDPLEVSRFFITSSESVLSLSFLRIKFLDI